MKEMKVELDLKRGRTSKSNPLLALHEVDLLLLAWMSALSATVEETLPKSKRTSWKKRLAANYDKKSKEIAAGELEKIKGLKELMATWQSTSKSK
jgi:hypothetical protein